MCMNHGEHVEKRMTVYEQKGRSYDIRQRLICGHDDIRCTTTILPMSPAGGGNSVTTVIFDTVVEHEHESGQAHDQVKKVLYKEELQRAKQVVSLIN